MEDEVEFRSGEALMAFGADLRVLTWNDAAESLTGIKADEAVGRFCWEVLRAADERGAMVCHAGCSYARLAREGWPVPTRDLWIRTEAGKELAEVSTVSVGGGDEPTFLHLIRRRAEVAQPSIDGSANGGCPEPPHLTPRQSEILTLLAEGIPAKTIARKLELSETTVRNHIRGILTQLGCHSQLEAVARGRRLGLLSEPS